MPKTNKRLPRRFAGTTVSEGTLQTRDLLEAALPFVRRVDRELATTVEAYLTVDADIERNGAVCSLSKELWQSQLECILLEAFECLEDAAPTGTYFGAHPGDGTLFGFWSVKMS